MSRTEPEISYSFRPRIRWPLDIQPILREGVQYLMIGDPEGIAENPILLTPGILPLLEKFNGENSLLELGQTCSEFGLDASKLHQLVEFLVNEMFLESFKVEEKTKQIAEQFIKSEVRQPSHAGLVYSEDKQRLEAEIESFVSKVNVPEISGDVSAIICPHIDYRRGWKTYCQAYHALKKTVPDVIILIGTAHRYAKNKFHLTKKNFIVPSAEFETDKELVTLLAKKYGSARSFNDELLHRVEHSLELQLPFIAHRFKGQKLPKIVPILVNSFDEYFNSEKYPIEHSEIEDFISGLQDVFSCVKARGENALFFAGIDLSHMGKFFGDSSYMSDSVLGIEQRDRMLLQAAYSANDRLIFEHLAEDRDARRICGYPSMYTMFAATNAFGLNLNGRELEYSQAVDREQDCIVSFASAYWS
jgi:MEMO1 family protein